MRAVFGNSQNPWPSNIPLLVGNKQECNYGSFKYLECEININLIDAPQYTMPTLAPSILLNIMTFLNTSDYFNCIVAGLPRLKEADEITKISFDGKQLEKLDFTKERKILVSGIRKFSHLFHDEIFDPQGNGRKKLCKEMIQRMEKLFFELHLQNSNEHFMALFLRPFAQSHLKKLWLHGSFSIPFYSTFHSAVMTSFTMIGKHDLLTKYFGYSKDKALRLLIDEGLHCDAEQCNSTYFEALSMASEREGSASMLISLIYRRAAEARIKLNLDELPSSQDSLYFIEACRSANMDLIHYLWQYRQTNLIRNTRFIEAFIAAAEKGNFQIFKYLLSAAQETVGLKIHVRDVRVLKAVAVGGDLDLLKKLLEEYSINSIEILNEVLFGASKGGNLSIIKYLLESSPKKVSFDGSKSFTCAASKGHLHVLKYLLERENDINPASLNSNAFRSAVANGHFHIVQYLLGKGRFPLIDLAAKDNEALITACSNGHLDIVKYVLAVDEKGVLIFPSVVTVASINASLRKAATNGHVEIVAFLLQRNPKSQSKYLYFHDPQEIRLDLAVIAAASNKKLEVLKEFLRLDENGQLVHPAVAPSFSLLLKRAFQEYNIAIMRFLLAKYNDGNYLFPGVIPADPLFLTVRNVQYRHYVLLKVIILQMYGTAEEKRLYLDNPPFRCSDFPKEEVRVLQRMIRSWPAPLRNQFNELFGTRRSTKPKFEITLASIVSIVFFISIMSIFSNII